MGLFDDVLGGDSDEEKEMQENIEEIRNTVQGDERGPPTDSGGPQTSRQPSQPGGEGRGGLSPDQDGPAPASGAEEPPQPQDRPMADRPQQGGGEQQGPPRRQLAEQDDRGPTWSGEQDGRGPERQGPTHDDVPEPPEVRDLDVPDIETGPLFITVDKFRDALEAISDLRRVAADMEDYIGSMEGTLQEDRETAEGIQDILDEAEGDTDDLQDIVSP